MEASFYIYTGVLALEFLYYSDLIAQDFHLIPTAYMLHYIHKRAYSLFNNILYDKNMQVFFDFSPQQLKTSNDKKSASRI